MNTLSKTMNIIQKTEKYSAHNYHPLPIVIEKASGCWVTDIEGEEYFDMLSAYSALNHGHRHPRILDALRSQADKVTLTSRAFHNDKLGELSEALARISGLGMSLPMNTGAEAVETAIKLARKWGYESKGVPKHSAEIVVFENNFHGRTISLISFSTEELYRDSFGPFTPGFKIVPFGDAEAFSSVISENTVACLIEPIQGEGGVIVPPEGFLRELREICTQNNVLMIADEIQTGLGRTGKMFCYQHEEISPDILILGKALGGGVFPLSVVCSRPEIMGLFQAGEHGSTFGGNPLGCAIGCESLRVLEDENLVERAASMGEQLKQRLQELNSPYVSEVRGKGLLLGVEIKEEFGKARPFCKSLLKERVLCKETHESVIRFAPPLTITQKEMDWVFEKIQKVLKG